MSDPQPLEIRTGGEDGRFSRFELISWWDQKRLAGAKILVIGAGALGNELVKNCALTGIGNVLVADMDRIENSQLVLGTRSTLHDQVERALRDAKRMQMQSEGSEAERHYEARWKTFFPSL